MTDDRAQLQSLLMDRVRLVADLSGLMAKHQRLSRVRSGLEIEAFQPEALAEELAARAEHIDAELDRCDQRIEAIELRMDEIDRSIAALPKD